MSNTKFLDALEGAEKRAGVYLFKGFLSESEADDLFAKLNNDADMPWDLKPTLGGQKLTQHVCHFDRSQKRIAQWSGLAELEALCTRMEEQLDGKVTYVFCNRFRDLDHKLPWHTDTYGQHIVVLSLGSGRKVQFRDFKTKTIEDVQPKAGDAYFMPLSLNDTHEHQVCPAESAADGTRISFVFFFTPPAYAAEYRISAGQKIKGFFTGLLS